MPFDLDGARKSGYSDTDIADFLSQKYGFDVARARKEGYGDTDIATFLAGYKAETSPTTTKPTEPAPESAIPSNPITDLAKGLYAGVTRRIPEQVGQALEYTGIAPESGKKLKEWAREGEVERPQSAFGQAGEMIPPSAGIPMALGALGKLVNLVPHPVAKGVGVGLNLLGAGLTPAMFAASQGQQTLENAEKQVEELRKQQTLAADPASKEAIEDEINRLAVDSAKAARWNALIEGLGETAGTFMFMRTLGKLVPAVTGAMTAKGAVKPTVKNFIKDMVLKQLPTEIATEIGQSGGEAAIEKEYGIRPDADVTGEALGVIGPTAIMTMLMGGAGGAFGRYIGNKKVNTLEDPQADIGKRLDVVSEIAGQIEKENPKLASSWKQYAYDKLGLAWRVGPNGSMVLRQVKEPQPIDTNLPFDNLSFEIESQMTSLDEATGGNVGTGQLTKEAFEKWEKEQGAQEIVREEVEAVAATPKGKKGKKRAAIAPEPAQEEPSTPAPAVTLPEAPIVQAAQAEGVEGGEALPIREATGPTQEDIDTAAQEAATSPENNIPEPTEAQKEAGNYKKGHIDFHGLDISIENPKGSTRSGTSPEGKTWETEMKAHYGYIKGTKGKDKDHLDVFIGEKPESAQAFVVDQVDPKTGKFDEHKIMFGYDSEEEARQGYLENYEPGWKGLGAITPMSMGEFKTWIQEGDTTKSISGQKRLASAQEEVRRTIEEAQKKLQGQKEALQQGVTVPPGIDNFDSYLIASGIDPIELGKKLKEEKAIGQSATDKEGSATFQAVKLTREWEAYVNNGHKAPESTKEVTEHGEEMQGQTEEPEGQEVAPPGEVTPGAAEPTTPVEPPQQPPKPHTETAAPSSPLRDRIARTYEDISPGSGMATPKVIGLVANAIETGVFNDMLRPDNKVSRKVFTRITGVPLPKGLKATQALFKGTPFKVKPERPLGTRDSLLPKGGQGSMTMQGFKDFVEAKGLVLANLSDAERRALAKEFNTQQQPATETDKSAEAKVEEKPKPKPKPKQEEEAKGAKPEPKPEAAPKAGWGEGNTIFTKERAEAAREKLRKKLNQLNVGIDPEILAAGLELAGYHIEAGARAFADYAKLMIEDIGDTVRPYLKSFYLAVRNYPGFDNTGMATEAEIDVAENPVEPEVKEEKGIEPPLHTFHDAEGNIDVYVIKNEKGFAVVMKDLGSGEYIDAVRIFPTEEAALARAKTLDKQQRSNTIKEGGTKDAEKTAEGDDSGPAEQPILAGAPGLDGGELPGEGHAASQGEPTEGLSRPDSGDSYVETVSSDREGDGPDGSIRDNQPGPDKPAGRPEHKGGPAETLEPGTSAEIDNLDGGVVEPAPIRNRNYRIGGDDVLYHSGQTARINANIRAIVLLKQLEQEGREATEDEKRVLLQYTGWGAVAQAVFNPKFDHYVRYARRSYPDPARYYNFTSDMARKYTEWEERWGKALHPVLGGILTEEEWKAAAESGTNAHYTSREVIERGLWPIAQRLGFKQGTAADPALGNGLIMGLIPEKIAGNVKLVGVELDNVTGRIAKQLYPDADIQVTGFEDAVVPDRSLDLIITNVPFGDYPISDRAHPAYSGWSVHNYFFARALDAVRPGGLVVAITSRYTMDSLKHSQVRAYLSEKADFVGAIRLPNTAFQKNAGTEVTTDIIVLRRKTPDPYPVKLDWLHHKTVKLAGDKSVQINEYFVDHPEMVLGQHSLEGSMYGGAEEYTLNPTPDADLAKQLDVAVKKLPKNIMGEGKAANGAYTGQRVEALNIKEGNYIVDAGKVYVVKGGLKETPDWSTDKEKTAQAVKYIEIRDKANDFIRSMQDPAVSDETIDAARKELNKLYDAYVEKYGRFHESRRSKFLQGDTEFPVALALERAVPHTNKTTINAGPRKGDVRFSTSYTYEKFDILLKRTIFPFSEPDKADNLDDAVVLSLTYYNRIDLGYVARVLGKTAEDARAALLESSLGFEDPVTGFIVHRSEYLSGNVRQKLKIAEDAGYQANVEALKKVQPKDWTIDEIYFRIGSEWLPPRYIQAFMQEVMDLNVDIQFTAIGRGDDSQSAWTVTSSFDPSHDHPSYTRWGYVNRAKDQYLSGMDIVLDSLNLKRVEIKDHERDEHGKITRTWRDEEATVIAQQKQKDIQAEFRKWVLERPEIARAIARLYNDLKNSFVVRQHDVPNITHYPNANKEITLRPHQKKAVGRGLVESTIFAHAVGTGKTYMYATLAMELRRTGQARKPMIIVQGSTLNQFAAQARRLYPGARILCPTKEDRTQQNRRVLLSRIATGDWDMVILPHSFFDGIAVSTERESRFLQEQIAEIEALIVEEGGDPHKDRQPRNASNNAKMLAKILKKKRERWEDLLEQREDDVMYWEDMGVDALLVDEAHYYKRGDFFTKMDSVKGLDRGAAAKSFRFLMKVRALQEKTGYKNIYLATGTPVSNTIAELWTLIRYVRPDILEAYGVDRFDGFATTFGDTVLDWEKTSTGDYKQVERFNKYVNGRNLINMWLSAADVILQEDVPNWTENVPKLRGGGIQSVVTPRSAELADFIKEIKAARDMWDELSGEDKMSLTWVPLDLYGQASLAAIDLRLVKAGAPDNPNSKINRCVKEVYGRWLDSEGVLGTQMVFCDVYEGRTKINIYQDIKKKLVARGIPAEQIAIVNDNKYNSDAAKEGLWEKTNEGAVRVLIGSTAKLGIGVNAQEKLVAVHHIDAPLRPMDFEQRNGRILRPGNTNHEVEILAYAVLNTLDSVTYDRLQKKQKFINQLLRGNIEGNSFEDPFDELQQTFEMLMAESEGNPLLRERFRLEGELRELEILKSGFIQKRGQLRTQEYEVRQSLPRMEKTASDAQDNAAWVREAFDMEKPLTITVNGQSFEHEKEGLKALGDAIREKADTMFGKFETQLKDLAEGVEMGVFRDIWGRLRNIIVTTGKLSTSLTINGQPVWLSYATEAIESLGDIDKEYCLHRTNIKGLKVVADKIRSMREDLRLRFRIDEVRGVNNAAAGYISDESYLKQSLRAFIRHVAEYGPSAEAAFEQAKANLANIQQELAQEFGRDEEITTLRTQYNDTVRLLSEQSSEIEGLVVSEDIIVDLWGLNKPPKPPKPNAPPRRFPRPTAEQMAAKIRAIRERGSRSGGGTSATGEESSGGQRASDYQGPFYIFDSARRVYDEVAGISVVIEGAEDFSFFVSQKDGEWRGYETSTGMHIPRTVSSSLDESVAFLKDVIAQNRDVLAETLRAHRADGYRSPALNTMPSVPDEGSGQPVMRLGAGITPPLPGESLSVRSVQDSIAPTLRKLSNVGRVRVVRGVHDLSIDLAERSGAIRAVQAGETVFGVYDPKADTTYIFSDSIADARTAKMVLIHEVVGHRGVRAILNATERKALEKSILDAYAGSAILDEVIKDYGLDLAKAGDRETALDELVAHITETRDVPTLWTKIVRLVKLALARLGLSSYKETDVERLIQGAFRYAEGKGRPFSGAVTGEESFRKVPLSPDNIVRAVQWHLTRAQQDFDAAKEMRNWWYKPTKPGQMSRSRFNPREWTKKDAEHAYEKAKSRLDIVRQLSDALEEYGPQEVYGQVREFLPGWKTNLEETINYLANGKKREVFFRKIMPSKKGPGKPTETVPAAQPEGGNPFKDSVVQEPVYHGTRALPFDVFNTEYGAFFSPSKKMAQSYTKLRESQVLATGIQKGKPRIIGAYLDIKNPLDLSVFGNEESIFGSRAGWMGYWETTGTKLRKLLKNPTDEKLLHAVKAVDGFNENLLHNLYHDDPAIYAALEIFRVGEAEKFSFGGNPHAIISAFRYEIKKGSEVMHERLDKGVKTFLESLGFDGVIFNDDAVGTLGNQAQEKAIVAFYPHQIKIDPDLPNPSRPPGEGGQKPLFRKTIDRNAERAGNPEQAYHDSRTFKERLKASIGPDINWFVKYLYNPFFKGQKIPAWKGAVNISEARRENRTEKNHKYFSMAKDFFSLQGDSLSKLEKVLIEGDATLPYVYADLLKQAAEAKAGGNTEAAAELKDKAVALKAANGYTDEDLRNGVRTAGGDVVALNDKEIAVYRQVRRMFDTVHDDWYKAQMRIFLKPYINRPWHDAFLVIFEGRDENPDMAKLWKALTRYAFGKYKATTEKGLERSQKRDAQMLKEHVTDVSGARDDAILIEAVEEMVAVFRQHRKTMNQIRKARNRIGSWIAYFPRVRGRGKYYMNVFEVTREADEKGEEKTKKTLVYNTTFGTVAQGERLEKEIRDELKNINIEVELGRVTRESEQSFIGAGDQNLQRLMDNAIDRVRYAKGVDADTLKGIKGALVNAIANELKARGFAQHAIRRRWRLIRGYETTGLQHVVKDYITGFSGMITKQEAAADFLDLLKTVPRKSVNLFEDISKYARDMLRNQETLDRVSGKARGLAFVWYLGANIRPMLLQITQNYVTGMPFLKEQMRNWGIKGSAEKAYHRAMKDAALSKIDEEGMVHGKNLSAEEKRMLREMLSRGIAEDQYIQEITARMENVGKRAWQKAIYYLSYPFSQMEVFNRKSAALAMFRLAWDKYKNVPNAEDRYQWAFEDAKEYVYKTHYFYGKENLPRLAAGGTFQEVATRTALTFRSFTHNYVLSLMSSKDWRTIAHSLAYVAMFGGLLGLPLIKDIFDLIERMTGKSYPKAIREVARKYGGRTLETFGMHGLPALAGANISGSMAIGIPFIGESPADTVYGVFGGMFQKGTLSAQAFGRGDVYRGFENALPEFVANPMKAARMSDVGREYLGTPGIATTQTGKVIFDENGNPLSMSGRDTAMKLVGLNPTGYSARSEAQRSLKNVETYFKDWRDDIYEEYRIARLKGDTATLSKALREIHEYNQSVQEKGARNVVSPIRLSNVIKAAKATATRQQRKEATYKREYIGASE